MIGISVLNPIDEGRGGFRMKISELCFRNVTTELGENIVPTNSIPNDSLSHVPELLFFLLQ